MNTDKLFGYIKNLKETDIQFEYRDISYGDRYYNENGGEFIFTIFNDEYKVGYSYITEDADDWAQAECYNVTWCRCNEKEIKADKVYELITNYKKESRNNKINEILN